MPGCTCSALNSRWSHAFSGLMLCSIAACKCHGMVTYITTVFYTCQQLCLKAKFQAKHFPTEQAIMYSNKSILHNILRHEVRLAMQFLRNCNIGRCNCRMPVFQYLPRQGRSGYGLRSIKLLLCVCYFFKQGHSLLLTASACFSSLAAVQLFLQAEPQCFAYGPAMG